MFMVSVNNNIAPRPMNNPELNIGVISAPDKFYKPVLYSDAEASQKFKALNRDVYSMQKKMSFEKTKDTPKSVFWILGSGILAALAIALKITLKKKS